MTNPGPAHGLAEDKDARRQEMYSKLAASGVSSDPPGQIPGFDGEGQAAEHLRRLDLYRSARIVFCAPDAVLRQARINALIDGKRLIVATPGLRSGMIEVTRASLPPWKFAWALSGEGLRQHGRPVRIARRDPGRPMVDLMITGAVAVDREGGRLGKGSGYFDLEFALFAAAGWADPAVAVAVIVHHQQITDRLPMADHDAPVDLIVTPEGVIPTGRSGPRHVALDPARLSKRALALPIVRDTLDALGLQHR